MILKQRFADGRTNYTDIGNDFGYVQKMAQDEFKSYSEIHKMNEKEREDCVGFICYDKKSIPIFKDYSQWIYSNDGQLFMNLT